LLSPLRAVPTLPVITLTVQQIRHLINGRQLALAAETNDVPELAGIDERSALVAILARHSENTYAPRTVFVQCQA
jgi:hypothetical protein